MRYLLILCFIASNISIAIAEDDAWMLLQKTASAARSLNYKGVFTYQNGNQARSVQITHTNDNNGEFTRDLVIDGDSREVYSKGDDVVILHPKHNKIFMERKHGRNLFPAILPNYLDPLKTSYSARIGNVEIVCGRKTQIIFLDAKDEFRYNYKLWTDADSGLLLKVALMNKSDVLERIEFKQVSLLNSQIADSMQPKIDVSKNYVVQNNGNVNQIKASDWVIDSLPLGYQKVDQFERTVPGKSVPTNQVIFSDGLAFVSLFIEPSPDNQRPKTGQITMGSSNMCADIVDNHQIIVVGEVPAEAVMLILKAVRFKK